MALKSSTIVSAERLARSWEKAVIPVMAKRGDDNPGVWKRVKQRRRASTHLEGQLQQLSSRLLQIQEQERAAIARELHDDIGQMIVLLEHRTANIQKTAGEGAPGMLRDLESLRTQVRQVAENVRNIAHRLHPAILEDLGLKAALRDLTAQFTRDYSIATRFVCRNLPTDMSPQVAGALYRITQECLRNVAKHAGKATAEVTIVGSKKSVTLTIKDTGKGFDPQRQKGGLGIIGMQERVALIGASFSIQSATGSGVQISVDVPVLHSHLTKAQGGKHD